MSDADILHVKNLDSQSQTLMQTRLFMKPGPVAQIVCSIVSSCLFVAMAFAGDPTTMLGFTARNAVNQLALEKKFDAQLDPAEQRAWLERMSAEPNHVGSTHNKANAEFMLEQFREWGWDAKIETFYVLYPTPKTQALELVALKAIPQGLTKCVSV